MAGRGMLFAEGPTACPFVALENDRDRRSDEPDPRHRCYAEPTPAPRALAHQREYCLSPGFGGCPIFQDWAIRAAARPVPLRPVTDSAGRTEAAERAAKPPDVPPTVPPSKPPTDEPAEPTVEFSAQPSDDRPGRPADEPVARIPSLPRDEQPTPPPSASTDGGDEAAQPPRRRWTEDWPPAAAPGAGAGAAVAGSGPAATEPPAFLADRASEGPVSGQAAQGPVGRPPPGRRVDYAPRPESVDQHRPARPSPRDEWAAQRADLIPSWERERYAAYPTMRTRVGLGDGGELLNRLTRIFVILAAVALAIALLIIAPQLIPAGIGGPTPSPSRATAGPTSPPTPTPTPSPTPSPSPQLYRIQPGDTLFGIAAQYNLTLDQLLAANPAITDPNLIQAGQVIVIPPPDFGLPTLPPPPTPAASPTP